MKKVILSLLVVAGLTGCEIETFSNFGRVIIWELPLGVVITDTIAPVPLIGGTEIIDSQDSITQFHNLIPILDSTWTYVY